MRLAGRRIGKPEPGSQPWGMRGGGGSSEQGGGTGTPTGGGGGGPVSPCQAPGTGRGDPPMMAIPWLAHVLPRRWPGPPACPQGHLSATLQDKATCTHCSGMPREAFFCPQGGPSATSWSPMGQGVTRDVPRPPVPNPNVPQAPHQAAVPRVRARPTSTRGMLQAHQGAGSGPKRGKITKGRLGGSSYPSQTRSPGHPACQERWPGRRSSCRGRGGPDSARGRGRQGKVGAVGTANITSVPRPRHASPTAPRPHPRARETRRAPAQSSAGAGGGPGNKGAGEIRQFFPST